jgi:hypothetical protein
MALPFAEIRFASAGSGIDGCHLGLGLVVEDKPTEFSCTVSGLINNEFPGSD